MAAVRRLAAPLAALLILLAPAAGQAARAPESVTARIFADYTDNRVLDGNWTASELDHAISVAKAEGPAFAEFEQAVGERYDRQILGLREDGPASGTPGLSLLPVPTAPGERDAPPWPLLALTALGGALVVTGAGSSLYRRARR